VHVRSKPGQTEFQVSFPAVKPADDFTHVN
jgi:hypothetical protein